MPLVENGIKRAFVHSLEEDLRAISFGYYVEIAGNEYNKNGLILPTGQWYAPSAVIKLA